MKLYDGGRAPNPRRVKVFLAEKGITVPTEQVDLGKLAHKAAAYTAINPLQRVPALELDDGTVIYVNRSPYAGTSSSSNPNPPLFGTGAKEMAVVEMWERRIEFHLLGPISHVFRNSHPAMKEMEVPQVPAWAEANKPRVMDFLALLDRELGARRYIAGEHYSVADITGMIAVDFMKPAKLAMPESLNNLKRWHEERVVAAEREGLKCG